MYHYWLYILSTLLACRYICTTEFYNKFPYSQKYDLSLYLFIDHPIHPPKADNDPWECEFLDDCGYEIKIVEGVYQIYKNEDQLLKNSPIDYPFPRLDEFVRDMHLMCALIADGPLKSFCYRRLSYLSSKFQLHVLLNELRELAAQKAVAHRDFYNVRKVWMSNFRMVKCIIVSLYVKLLKGFLANISV